MLNPYLNLYEKDQSRVISKGVALNMCKKPLFSAILLSFLTCSASEDLFVSPDGNDAWSGKLNAPNAAKSDGPFATVSRAQKAVRELKVAQPERKTPISVQLRGGMYALKDPIVFTSEDSGSAAGPIIYSAAPGEMPVLSGGVKLSGFKADEKGRWVLQIPEVQKGEWTFNQLWVNGERRYRPRLPKNSYYTIEGEVPATPAAGGKGYDRFKFRKGEIKSDWKNRDDVEVLTFHQWEMSRFLIANVDDEKQIVQFTGRTISAEHWSALKTGWRYIVENVAEALDQPGEWYLDRKSGMLTYIPKPGEDIATAEIIAPRIEQLLLIKGDAPKGKFVDHIRFENLTFAHSAWKLPPQGYSFYQAEMIIPGSIVSNGMRDCSFIGCAIAHTGGYGLDIISGCKRNRIESCALYDLNAGGIKIGEGGIRDKEDELTSHNTISNCIVAYCGRMHPAGIGVWIGQSPFNTVEHCEIYDLYYSSFSVGWTWGYGKSAAHHNTIAFNHMHKIGQNVLSDMGGVYTLGIQPGTVIHHNRIHDVSSFTYGGWGLYTDEGSSGVLMENNIVYRTKSSGFHQHYGRDNRVQNNIFAYGEEAQWMRTRDEQHLSFTIERNIVLYNDTPLLGSNWNGDSKKFAINKNLYWNEGGPVNFAGKPMDEWRKKGVDADSLIADPLFTDPGKGDFTLKPGSPAEKIGFQPIDASTIGIQKDKVVGALKGYLPIYEEGLAKNAIAPAFPVPGPPPPPMAVNEDFESTAVGEKAQRAATDEDKNVKVAVIRVTDEAAASGKHSLKFTDAAGQKYSFMPYYFYEPHFTQGVLMGSFNLRMEPGAVFFHEWRTPGEPYHAGPSLRVEADGSLNAGGKTLLKLPHGKWVKFEITASVGKSAKAEWDLAVTLPDVKEPQRFGPLKGSKLKSLGWYGFVSDTNGPSVFYLDDVRLQPKDME